jgi:predicted acetyltransferase
MSLEIRTLDASDVADWVRALHTGFHLAPSVTDEEVAVRRVGYDLERTRGAYDQGRCVATFRSMPRELTVPGGAFVPATAITNVSVTATHRRRGLASRLMAADLADAKERGEALAILVAAEYPIYGRFGFGPATWVADWEVDLPRAALDHRYAGPTDGGRVDLVDVAEVRKAGPALHERVRAQTPGAISRTAGWWEIATGERIFPSQPWTEPFFAVHRDADGEVQGLLSYTTTDHHWPGKLPRVDATVRQLLAATPAAEQALWRFVLSLDWVTLLNTGHRAPDDVLPLLLGDPRAARTETLADFMWLRVLDVPAALSARTYGGAPGRLVLQVRDGAGLCGGRYVLETDASGAGRCTPAGADAADLTLDVADLGCLYLGDESASRLAVLGRVAEHRPGAVRAADALFRTARRPWCPEVF